MRARRKRGRKNLCA
ncbi:MAG: hypothetical protein R3235_09505 [Altererythrobacter ishigakiensis]|nr:hypothetical protein [Altererythrobacter ishigakiensis]